ncbi:hypothetical protein C8054_25050 [Micromonospora sp. RP3T]|nr:hypothetical protein C8054_25050 [Micromonospora sp. RP3T]
MSGLGERHGTASDDMIMAARRAVAFEGRMAQGNESREALLRPAWEPAPVEAAVQHDLSKLHCLAMADA